jgi:hypothetical protein
METGALTLPTIPALHFSILAITPDILLLVLGVFMFFYLIVSAVLFYHWSAYGMHSPGIVFGKTIFSIFSIVLIFISWLSITYY